VGLGLGLGLDEVGAGDGELLGVRVGAGVGVGPLVWCDLAATGAKSDALHAHVDVTSRL